MQFVESAIPAFQELPHENSRRFWLLEYLPALPGVGGDKIDAGLAHSVNQSAHLGPSGAKAPTLSSGFTSPLKGRPTKISETSRRPEIYSHRLASMAPQGSIRYPN